MTGRGVIIKDTSTGLYGLVWVDADTHTWSNGVATMDLVVTLKKIMDVKEYTTEVKSSGTGSDTDSSTSVEVPKVEPVAGSETDAPFAVLNKYYLSQKEDFASYDEAYAYFIANSGHAEGWHIVDKQRKDIPVATTVKSAVGKGNGNTNTSNRVEEMM